MSLQLAFASMIYQGKCLAPTSSLFRALQKEVFQIETADGEGREWSAERYPNGYTSYGSWDQLHRMSPHFEELKDRLDPHVHKFVKSLNWDVPTANIQMSKIWVNIMGPGAVHTSHIHPLSVISGTFYLDVDKNASPLQFEDPRLGLFMNRPPLKAKVPVPQQAFLKFFPKPGEVILFESWMRHEVPLQKSKKNRISVSFNYDWIPPG